MVTLTGEVRRSVDSSRARCSAAESVHPPRRRDSAWSQIALPSVEGVRPEFPGWRRLRRNRSLQRSSVEEFTQPAR